jgi:ubiquinone/menaquinone biosynthesis C-methylase UbiE
MRADNPSDEYSSSGEKASYWNEVAASFDEEPDHGLLLPRVRRAWTRLLKTWLPVTGADVLDVGCGTGSLSLVMATLGHRVVGIDIAPAMIVRAQAKARAQRQAIAFCIMDAAAPSIAPESFNVIVCRHVLWTLPQPTEVLKNWRRVLRPGGRLILIEGYWHTGAGLHAAAIRARLPSSFDVVSVTDLSGQVDLWGKQVNDERFAVVADKETDEVQ